jgi:hypothetical protein
MGYFAVFLGLLRWLPRAGSSLVAIKSCALIGRDCGWSL